MTTVRNILETSSVSEASSVSHLAELYKQTIEKLRQCANFKPELDAANHEVDLRETNFLDQEETLLEQASRIQLRSKDDVDCLMDIWMKVSGVQTGEDIRPSDRIAMNIFRHMSDVKFATD